MALVTSYTEVWIEMTLLIELTIGTDVTSYTEVWIEMIRTVMLHLARYRHFLHGSVD